MIGKPEWFTYRIMGWGIRPKTKEAWIYTGIVIGLISMMSILPLPVNVKLWTIGSIIVLTSLDAIHIMMQLPKVHDERHNYHQLIIERNVSFASIISLVTIILVQAYKNGFNNEILIDYWVIVVLGVMVLTKMVSTFYVTKKM